MKFFIKQLEDNQFINDIESISQYWKISKQNKARVNLASQFDKFRK